MQKGLEPLQQTITSKLAYCKDRVELTSCPVCKENNFQILDEVRQPIFDSHLVICKECGFITYNPQLKDLEQFYIDNVRPQSLGFLTTKKNKLAKHEKLILKYLADNNLGPKSILDLGASDGYLLKELKGLYPKAKLTAVEANKGHLNWIKYWEDYNCDCHQRKETVQGKFDLIILYHVLEHLQEPTKWLAWINEHLSDNGLIYIALPTLDRLDYPSINELFKDEHINWFTDNTLRQYLGLNGFEPVFENTYIYGTTLILKKSTAQEKIKNYYKENLEKLARIVEVYKIKDMMDSTHNPQEITTLMRQAVSVYPKFPEIIAKGVSIMELIDSLDYLENYLKDNPDNTQLKLQLALTYYKDEQFDKSKELFLKAIEENGITEMALNHLVFISIQKGEVKEALSYLKQLVKEYPLSLQHYEILFNVLSKL